MEEDLGRALYPMGTFGEFQMTRQLHITFCGMDGAGKSTLGRLLEEWVKDQGIQVKYIHGHSYSASSTSFNLGANEVLRFRLLFRCALPLVYIDNLFTYYMKYRPILRNTALITDRYFYDKVCRLLFYRIATPSLAVLLLRLLPRPDFTFVLDLDSQKAFDRKGEYSIEEYETFRRGYRFVAKTVGATVIDTGQPLEACWKEIRSILEDRFVSAPL